MWSPVIARRSSLSMMGRSLAAEARRRCRAAAYAAALAGPQQLLDGLIAADSAAVVDGASLSIKGSSLAAAASAAPLLATWLLSVFALVMWDVPPSPCVRLLRPRGVVRMQLLRLPKVILLLSVIATSINFQLLW